MNFHNDYCPSSLEMISTGAQNSSTDCSSGLEYQGVVLGYWTTGNHDEIIAVPIKLTSVWTASIPNIILLLLSLKYSFSSVAIVIAIPQHSLQVTFTTLFLQWRLFKGYHHSQWWPVFIRCLWRAWGWMLLILQCHRSHFKTWWECIYQCSSKQRIGCYVAGSRCLLRALWVICINGDDKVNQLLV